MDINNGIIICYGSFSHNQNQIITLTYPISFLSTRYCICFASIRNKIANEWYCIGNLKTNNCSVYPYATAHDALFVIISN